MFDLHFTLYRKKALKFTESQKKRKESGQVFKKNPVIIMFS